MPSQNMLPKGKRRQSVMQEYRKVRSQVQELDAARAAAGEVEDEDGPVDSLHDTADFIPLHVSPFAGATHLVTSGPNGGKHPQEEASLSKPRYTGLRAPLVTEAAPEIQVLEDLEPEDGVRTLTAEAASEGMRLDAYLARAILDISRARVVLLIDGGQVTVDGKPAKGKQKLKGGELIEIEGEPRPEPLNATPEEIPLTVVYEDDDLAVIDKPAGMLVHAGSGGEEHNRGTLVNALLFRFASAGGTGLSNVGGDLRPGIVHRLDKQTSGLIVVAKNDLMHRKLGEMFSDRRLRKVYLAMVHGWVAEDEGTIQLPIARDLLRRIRMTTKRSGGRSAVSHWRVLERIGTPERPGRYGKFTLLEVRIETGRTHQIRVHLQAIGHPVVGDFLYGAPHRILPVGPASITERGSGLKAIPAARAEGDSIALDRNFLHAAELDFAHPRTGEALALRAGLPEELIEMLQTLRQP